MSEDFTIPQNAMVDFYADWCSPCKQMDPILDELKNEGHNIIQVDVEENQLMTKYFDIVSIPTFVFIKDGKEFHRFTGVVPKHKLEDYLKKIKEED